MIGRQRQGKDPGVRIAMRLATVATERGPRAAVLVDDRYVDVQDAEPTLPATVRGLLDSGPEAIRRCGLAAQRAGIRAYEIDQASLLPPIPDPPKIVCLGKNYAEHAAETGGTAPREPILFSKYATALTGSGQPIVLPTASREVDFEAELVVVVGRRGRHLREEDALSYVAGYTIGNDVSARDWQLKKDGRQWMVGKTFDTFAPTGPVLVSADEVPDPHDLGIRLRLNGELMQDSHTSRMIFRISTVLAYLSQVFTLEPGDLIFTGTPPGVGFARQPPVYLRAGDVVEVEIDRLGVLRNPVVQG